MGRKGNRQHCNKGKRDNVVFRNLTNERSTDVKEKQVRGNLDDISLKTVVARLVFSE